LLKFISKLGRSQVEHEIQSRVKGITKRSAKILEDNSGVKASLEDENIDEYIKLILKEKEKMTKTNSHTTTNDNKDNHEVSR
jgi:hypothetical protein